MSRRAEFRVWVDDDLVHRAAPDGWVHVTTAWDATERLKTGRVVELSLDHDLSDDDRFGRGVDFIAEQQEAHDRDPWPRDGIHLHTGNHYGRDAIARTIRRYAEKAGYRVHESPAGGQPHLTIEKASG